EVDLGNVFAFYPGGYRTSIGLHSFLLALNPFNFEAYLERGRAHGRLGEARDAIADYSLALALMPRAHQSHGEALLRRSNHYRFPKRLPEADADLQTIVELDLDLPLELQSAAARQCNNFAWRSVTGPETQRDAQRALPLARKAVQLMPDEAAYWNTL